MQDRRGQVIKELQIFELMKLKKLICTFQITQMSKSWVAWFQQTKTIADKLWTDNLCMNLELKGFLIKLNSVQTKSDEIQFYNKSVQICIIQLAGKVVTRSEHWHLLFRLRFTSLFPLETTTSSISCSTRGPASTSRTMPEDRRWMKPKTPSLYANSSTSTSVRTNASTTTSNQTTNTFQ